MEFIGAELAVIAPGRKAGAGNKKQAFGEAAAERRE
jgi:hypothetical protein